MKKILLLGLFFIGITTHAATLVTDHPTYDVGDTVLWTGANGFNYVFLYREGDDTLPLCYVNPAASGNINTDCTLGAALFDPTTEDTYHFVQAPVAGCQTDDLTTCLFNNSGSPDGQEAIFEICTGGGSGCGGGGGGGTGTTTDATPGEKDISFGIAILIFINMMALFALFRK